MSIINKGGPMKRFFSGILCLFFLGLLLSADIECKKNRQSIQNEAGFITIEPILFYFHYGSYTHRLPLQSSEARIWYSFHAADQDGWKKPLFVFFNGGPGSSTGYCQMLWIVRILQSFNHPIPN
jgi:hypothetical protein